MQNGKEAGQTHEHVHLHLIPVFSYEALKKKENVVEKRTEEEMGNEANTYRALFQQSTYWLFMGIICL